MLSYLYIYIYVHISVCVCVCVCRASQVALVVKNLPASVGDVRDSGLIPGSGRFLGGGYSNPLQYSCLEKHLNRGASWVTVHWVT